MDVPPFNIEIKTMNKFDREREVKILRANLQAVDSQLVLSYNKKTGMYDIKPKPMAWFPKDTLFKLALLGCVIGIPIISGLAVFT